MLKDYKDLSKLAVFLEQVSADEKYYEFSEYSSSIKPVENALYVHLCNLQILVQSINSTISHYVKGDVMDDSLRHLPERSERFMRDYVIFNIANNFAKHLETKYEILRTELRDAGN